MLNKCSITTLLAGAAICHSSSAALVSFDENSLPTNSFFNPQASATFNSSGVAFDHSWSYDCCWGNFTYSNRSDTTTPGFNNDRSAITGTGAGAGADNYGVSFGSGAYIDFGTLTDVGSAQITNTTYAYLSMRDGDGFAKQFGVNDYFHLIINGLDASGAATQSVTFALAQGTNIVDQWTQVSLASLGNVYGLSFDYASSDSGQFGVNTPSYFAIDNLAVTQVPLPAAWAMFSAALAGLLLARRR